MTPGVPVAVASVVFFLVPSTFAAYDDAKSASGARIWVDPKTPGDAYTYTSSRGDKWELVMSDEFDTPQRRFQYGVDHLWTAIEGLDTVDQSLEYYSASLATTECEDNVVCYLKLQTTTVPKTTSVWVQDAPTPGMQNITRYYQSAMLQSWNKFCFQGGMVEVRAQLPGIISGTSTNPDATKAPSARVNAPAYYPTWPGVWLMGNLGRVLFRDSTDRMWPFSYNVCEPDVFDPQNQRISACTKDPGSGMNSKQGRGAPQIDILQGGGLDIIASLQVGPGMPSQFRRIPGESPDCIYDMKCKTLGANTVGVPTATYATRKYKSWYQGLRYAFNPFCAKNVTEGVQTLATITASLQAGITANKCDVTVCPASLDVNSDLGALVGSSSTTNKNWGINTDGSCFATMNTYDGVLLAGNQASSSGSATSFSYYADSISTTWPIHKAMYTDFLAYQIEWVPGKNGYIRWMLERQPIFELPAEALTDPPQDSDKKNPHKIIPEEPMYLIMNVALSSTWSARPPNPGRACNNGNDKLSDQICGQFPLAMKIDYVRVYQDVSATSTMSVGCDPATHPTRKWIKDHIKEYQNGANPVVTVAGQAFCVTNGDCTASGVITGSCVNGRCQCSRTMTGPRCTVMRTGDDDFSGSGDLPDDNTPSFGTNKLSLVFGIGAGVLFGLVLILYIGRKIRLWLFYRSQPEIEHTVINRASMETGQARQDRWWDPPNTRRAETPAEGDWNAYGRGARTTGGLPPIPETPPGAAFGNTAASAA